MKIDIYTDGSAVAKATSGNYMKGGMGVVFISNGELMHQISTGYFPTKTGRMEIMAVLTALKTLKKNQKATIHSDSMYVVNCFNEKWLEKWEHKLWPSHIKNKDLLKPLLEEYRKFPLGSIKLKHIKGHNGNQWNELADSLANYKIHDEYKTDLPESAYNDGINFYANRM